MFTDTTRCVFYDLDTVQMQNRISFVDDNVIIQAT